MKHGWKPGPTKTKILSCIGEQFGSKVRESLEPTLKSLVELEEAKREGYIPVKPLREQYQRDLKTQRTRLLHQLKTRA